MPERVYMGIDGRRDHGFRVPRPDLSERLGVPDACTSCHSDRSADWAAAEIERRYPGLIEVAAGQGIQSVTDTFGIDMLVGRPVLLVNAVRGVVSVGTLDSTRLPADPRIQELADAFWPA